jgi:hypothetical protein
MKLPVDHHFSLLFTDPQHVEQTGKEKKTQLNGFISDGSNLSMYLGTCRANWQAETNTIK